MNEQISEPQAPKVIPSASDVSSPEPEPETRLRTITFKGFELIADILHLVVGVLLVIIAVAVIISVVFHEFKGVNPFCSTATTSASSTPTPVSAPITSTITSAQDSCSGSDTTTIAIGLVDSVLFVVIVLELLDTVLTYLRDRNFALRPFLIIGIISSVRHILIIGAKLSEADKAAPSVGVSSNESVITRPIVELMVSAMVAVLLVICYWIVGKTSDSRTR